jgi:prevent-host-death family protein
MRTKSATQAKNRFALLIDTARAEPASIEKHGQPVAVVAVKVYRELLKSVRRVSGTKTASRNRRAGT